MRLDYVNHIKSTVNINQGEIEKNLPLHVTTCIWCRRYNRTTLSSYVYGIRSAFGMQVYVLRNLMASIWQLSIMSPWHWFKDKNLYSVACFRALWTSNPSRKFPSPHGSVLKLKRDDLELTPSPTRSKFWIVLISFCLIVVIIIIISMNEWWWFYFFRTMEPNW